MGNLSVAFLVQVRNRGTLDCTEGTLMFLETLLKTTGPKYTKVLQCFEVLVLSRCQVNLVYQRELFLATTNRQPSFGKFLMVF